VTAVAQHGVPNGAGYSLLLVAHVAFAVVGFAALGVTGVQAARARGGPGSAGAESVRRYFRPGTNWVARTLYLVPLFGFALVAASHGAFAVSDGFVLAGLVLWAVAALAAELLVWPAERRIQRAIDDGWSGDRSFRGDCTKVAVAASGLAAVFVAAVVLMVSKP
jgi:hypothetical protein